jgi:hypothetical protein
VQLVLKGRLARLAFKGLLVLAQLVLLVRKEKLVVPEQLVKLVPQVFLDYMQVKVLQVLLVFPE